MNNTKTALKLTGIAVAMFAFGFALVPIYDIICDITGLNGKTGVAQIEAVTDKAYVPEIDTSRSLTVEFIANLNQSMPLAFSPVVKKMKVHPGDIYSVEYTARNKTDALMIGQAVPSLSPAHAAAYFDKIECFCFSNQKFEPYESRRLALTFTVSPELPKYVKTVSLAYTFFDISKTVSNPS